MGRGVKQKGFGLRPRGRFRSRKKSTFRIAKAALSGVKKLRRQVEGKWNDFTSSYTASASGTIDVSLLSGVSQGDTAETRDGLRVVPTSLFIRYMLTAHLSGGEDAVRVSLIKDKFPKGAFLTLAQLYDTTAFLSPLKRENTDRFSVMYDRVHRISGTHGPEQAYVKKYFRLSGQTTYKGTDSLIASADTNHYFLVTHNQGGSNRPTFNSVVRFSYKDP